MYCADLADILFRHASENTYYSSRQHDKRPAAEPPRVLEKAFLAASRELSQVDPITELPALEAYAHSMGLILSKRAVLAERTFRIPDPEEPLFLANCGPCPSKACNDEELLCKSGDRSQVLRGGH